MPIGDRRTEHIAEKNPLRESLGNILRLFLCFGFGCFMLILFFIAFAIFRPSAGTQAKLGNKAKGRPVTQYKLKTAKMTTDMAIDPANNRKYVDITGTPATPTASLTDPEFGLEVKDALRLKRVVEMRQWQEIRTYVPGTGRNGGRYEFSYKYKWQTSPINSDRYNQKMYKNPKTWKYTNKVWNAEDVTMGPFSLMRTQIQKFDKWQPVPLSEVKSLPPGSTIKGNYLYIVKNGPKADRVGELRIRFFKVLNNPVTIRGKQIDDRLQVIKLSPAKQAVSKVSVEEE